MHKRTPTKSGGREPAVGMRNTFAQTQARLFAGPPTVYVRIAVAFVLIVATGGLRPPLLCCSANVCRRKNDFCDAQTHAQKERRASARRGVRNRTCKGNTAKSRETVTDGLVNVIAITVA
jgi:hypothetical protein